MEEGDRVYTPLTSIDRVPIPEHVDFAHVGSTSAVSASVHVVHRERAAEISGPVEVDSVLRVGQTRVLVQ